MGKDEQINDTIGLLEAYRRMTPREVEVFELSLEGKTNKTIGKELNISWHTAKKHRENIRTKLEIEGHNALFVFAKKNSI